MQTRTLMAGALVLAAWTGLAGAVLPPPTPAQVQAQAAKKAAADAQAEKDKQLLMAKMDAVAGAWRAKAAEKGWKLNGPTALPSPVAAVTAPATQSGSNAQPDGKLGAVAAQAPMTSEKSGTAAPSADVKPAPSPPASTVKTQ
jgi:hypothetical protein